MNANLISQVVGTGIPIMGDDIDTDRIIPARFMKCLTFDGLGQYLFYDARRHKDGSINEHPLNDSRFTRATILLTGNNFGCGSSREHAPQSIYRAGFRAIIAQGFAEIFFGNATQLGIPCIKVSKEGIALLSKNLNADPSTQLTIDIEAQRISWEDGSIYGEIPDGPRQALLQGEWDALNQLLRADSAIDQVGRRLGYLGR